MTKLEQRVRDIISEQGTREEQLSFMQDVLRYGCQSGLVGELVYYADTVKFYNEFKEDINQLLVDMFELTGETAPEKLFGEKWEIEDPLSLDQYNQNLLAWFGFEETTRRISEQQFQDE